tara:strand:- start:3585 stop:4604 length:1020 start_codon:yes stop_codon:yes gene_type:complete
MSLKLSAVSSTIKTQDYLDTYFGRQLEYTVIESLPKDFLRSKAKDIIKPFVNEYIKTILGSYKHLNPIGINVFNHILQKNDIANIQIKNLGFDKKFFMRYSENSNLYDICSKIDKSIFDKNFDNLLGKISSSLNITKDISRDIFTENKINIDLSLRTRNLLIEKTLEVISASIFEVMNIDIIFIYIDMGGTHNLITSTKSSMPEKSYFIYVNPTNKKDGTIFFNFVLKIDIVNPLDNSLVVEGDLLKYVYTNLLGTSITKSETIASKEIEYNPNDRDELLNVIEVTNKKGIPKTFLLGRGPEYNLYIDDDSTNRLVGRLEYSDMETLKVNISWCESYDF